MNNNESGLNIDSNAYQIFLPNIHTNFASYLQSLSKTLTPADDVRSEKVFPIANGWFVTRLSKSLK